MVRSYFARALDRWIDRGEGADPSIDPYGPPLADDEVAHLLDIIRTARFEEGKPPFTSPIALADTAPRVGALLRAPRKGSAWAVLALPYGGFYRPGALGVYEIQARSLAARGFGIAALEAPYHGARIIAGQRSGWGFVRADLGHTARACAAYASEVGALIRHVREREGAERVVGLGLSLGGNALGLASALGAPVDRLAFLAAVDNPVSFYATGSNRARRRRTLAAHGIGMPEVAAAFAPFSPSSYPAPEAAPALREGTEGPKRRSAEDDDLRNFRPSAIRTPAGGTAPESAPALFAIPQHDLVVPAATQEAWRATWGGELLDLGWEGHGLALGSLRAARRIAAWLQAD